MENTIGRGEALSHDPSAVQNSADPTSGIKLILLWLAVGAPLLWGAIKALQDIGSLPL